MDEEGDRSQVAMEGKAVLRLRSIKVAVIVESASCLMVTND